MIKLEYPVVTPTDSVELRGPEPGNTRQYHHEQVLHDIRSGEVRGISDWPKYNIMVYSFTTLTKTVRDDFESFYKDTAGLLVKLTDHNSVAMSGYITTPTAQIVHVRGICSYNLSFEFHVEEEL